MATYTLIEVNGDYAHLLDDGLFGMALHRVIRNPSNVEVLNNLGYDRAVRIVGTSMEPHHTTRKALIAAQLREYPDSKIIGPQNMYAWLKCNLNIDKIQKGWLEHDAVLYAEGMERQEAWRHYIDAYKARWYERTLGAVLNAMQYPHGVFYECGLREDGRYEYRGFRFGVRGSEYLSGFPGELG